MKLFIKTEKMISLIGKRPKVLLLIELCLGLVLFLILGYLYYNIRKESYCEKVEETFKELLFQQLQENSLEGYLFTTERKSTLGTPSDTAYVTDESGKHAYPLDREKNRKNITHDPRARSLHSAYLSVHPLVADSLYKKWQQHLVQQNLTAAFALQLLVSDKKGNTTNCVAPNDISLKDYKPCFDVTIGYFCEVEIKVFFVPSYLQLMGMGSLIYGLLYWLLVVICIWAISRKKKPEALLVSTSSHIYNLDQNITFDADLRKLITDKEEIVMPPQTAVLLRHFLDTSDHILKDEDIQKIFWSDKSDNEPRLHNVISRLRLVFANIPSIEVQRYEKNGYRLHIRRY